MLSSPQKWVMAGSCSIAGLDGVLEKLDLMIASLTEQMNMLGRVRVLGDSWGSQADNYD